MACCCAPADKFLDLSQAEIRRFTVVNYNGADLEELDDFGLDWRLTRRTLAAGAWLYFVPMIVGDVLFLLVSVCKCNFVCNDVCLSATIQDEKLSCRRKTARCFVSLNISPNQSSSVKIIRNGTIRKLGYSLVLAFHSNYGFVLYHFREKARYWPKIANFFSYPLHSTPPLRGPVGILPYRLVWKTRMLWLPMVKKVKVG